MIWSYRERSTLLVVHRSVTVNMGHHVTSGNGVQPVVTGSLWNKWFNHYLYVHFLQGHNDSTSHNWQVPFDSYCPLRQYFDPRDIVNPIILRLYGPLFIISVLSVIVLPVVPTSLLTIILYLYVPGSTYLVSFHIKNCRYYFYVVLTYSFSNFSQWSHLKVPGKGWKVSNL